MPLLFLSSLAHAAVPNVMNFQAKLTDPSNVLLTDTYNFTFRIFNVATGGTNLWNEQQRLYVDNGIVNALLGNNTLLNLSFSEDYYLEIQINTETLTPRRRLGSSSYAFRANTSEDLVCTSCVESGDIASNAVTTAKIANNAVTSAKLATDLSLSGNLSVNTSVLFIDSVLGRVGILTTAPLYVLDVRGAVNASSFVNASTLLAGFGSASSPSIAFAGDTNTGIFRIGSGQISFATSGSARVTINGSNVGIGTTNPAHPLHVIGDINVTGNIFGNVSLTDLVCTGCVDSTDIASNAVTTSKIAGSAVTSAKLASDLTLEGNLSAASGLFYLANNTRRVGINDTTPDGIFDVDVSGAADALVVSATTGNVGIGTASPATRLHTVGANNANAITATATSTSATSGLAGASIDLISNTTQDMGDGFGGYIGLNIQDATSGVVGVAQIEWVRDGADNSGAIRFTTRNAGTWIQPAMIIKGSGNVGINTTAPTQTLTVVGRANITGGASNIVGLFVADNGRVGIGTGAPAHALHVIGDANITGNIFGNISVTDLTCTGCVDSTDLASNAVTTAKIANSAVTSAKLASDLALSGNLTVNASVLFVDGVLGRVGINSVAPAYRLHVISDDSTNQSVIDMLTLEHTTTAISNGTSGIGVGILMRAEDTIRDVENVTLIQGILTTATNASETSALTFWTRTGGSALTEKLRISGDGVVDVNGTLRSNGTTHLAATGGRVGIGTLSPVETLDVRGSLNVSGNVNGTFVGTLGANTVDSAAIQSNAVTSAKIANDAVTSAKLADDLTLEGNLNAGSGIFYVANSTRAVGINTTSPTQTLTVIGTANITGGASNKVGLIVDDEGFVSIGEGNNTKINYSLVVSGGTADAHISADIRSGGDGSNNAMARFNNFARTGGAGQEWTAGLQSSSMTGGERAFTIRDETRGLNRLVIDTSGRVGIGTGASVPTQNLTVVGTANITGGASSVVGLVVTTNGSVGVGKGSPAQTFDVSGGAAISGNVGIGTASPNDWLTINQGAADDTILSMQSSDVAHGVTNRADTNTYGFMYKADAAAGGLWIEGIAEEGSALPAVRLVGGATGDTTRTSSSRGIVEINSYLSSPVGGGQTTAGANILAIRENEATRFLINDEGNIYQLGSGGTNNLIATDGSSYLMGGNVGINTTSPTALLSINPAANVIGLNITGAAAPVRNLLVVQNGTTPAFVVNSSGVGVGTFEPSEAFEVYRTTTGGYTRISINNPGSAANSGATLAFKEGTSRNAVIFYENVNDIFHMATDNPSELRFSANGPFGANITLTSAGDVGINTASPVAKLDVRGGINATTFINGTFLQSVRGNITIDHGNLVMRNPAASTGNTTQERWLDTNGRVVAMRYWNGTALVLNVTG